MAHGIEADAEVGEFQRNAVKVLVARLTTVHGTACVDMRDFALNTAGGRVATRRGVTVRRAQIGKLKQLVDKLVAACEARGDATEDGEPDDAPSQQQGEPS